MEVLLYTTETNEAGKRLEKVIKTSLDRLNIRICRTINSLTQKLRQPRDGFGIAVLLAHSKESLSEILSLKDLFWNLGIILILPDNETDTISRGHRLYPRFLSYIDSDFSDVAAVLGKMLNYSKYYNFN
ncbi:MAG: hypothetical protein JRE28_12030 [Deltaproteobacteria bacterium]|nr:hypothetical protein [Deltaproteobacteria bacterium]